MRMDEESDRRSSDRFEVVGDLWGYFTVTDSLRVRDVSKNGVLALSKAPLAIGSIHAVSAPADGRVDDVRLRVTHVRRAPGGHAEHLVGFECVDEDRAFWNRIVGELASDKGHGHDA